jgi:hypothetical protein
MSDQEPKSTQNASGEVIGMLGETELTRQGWAWLPVSQFIVWGVLSRESQERNPNKSWIRAGVEGFCKMVVMLGSEWGHNLAHLSASNLIGKPMDQFRIQLGMPRCIYHKLNDPEVEPKEHVVRALGGPVFNMMVLPFTCLARRVTRPDSIAGATARTAFQTNLFLSLISLLPIPGIDGAPILKWSLVERGKTVAEADEVVRKANGPLAILLGLTSSAAFLKKKPLIGFFSLMLGGISLSVYTGLLKEEDVSI